MGFIEESKNTSVQRQIELWLSDGNDPYLGICRPEFLYLDTGEAIFAVQIPFHPTEKQSIMVPRIASINVPADESNQTISVSDPYRLFGLEYNPGNDTVDIFVGIAADRRQAQPVAAVHPDARTINLKLRFTKVDRRFPKRGKFFTSFVNSSGDRVFVFDVTPDR